MVASARERGGCVATPTLAKQQRMLHKAYTPTITVARATNANCAHVDAKGEMERQVGSTAIPLN